MSISIRPLRGASIDLVAPLRHGLPIERRYRRTASERLEIAQRQQARLGIAEQRGDPLTVIAPLAGPIQRVAAEAVDVVHQRPCCRRMDAR